MNIFYRAEQKSLLQHTAGADHCYPSLSTQAETTKEAATPSQQFKVTILAYAGLVCSPEQANLTQTENTSTVT